MAQDAVGEVKLLGIMDAARHSVSTNQVTVTGIDRIPTTTPNKNKSMGEATRTKPARNILEKVPSNMRREYRIKGMTTY